MAKYDYNGICPFNAIKVDFSDKEKRIKEYLSYMFDRTVNIFKYNNLPKTIPHREFELMLQNYGYVAFYKYNDELYVFRASLGGVPNEYYYPTIAIITNPYLNISVDCKIDEDCIIMANDSCYTGLFPLHNRYANLLVENNISIRLADINERIQALISDKDDRTKESAKKYLKDIEDGKLGIIGESAFLDGLKSQPYQSQANNIITQLIELEQYLKASWYNEIGLNANYNMKRESINSNESQLNDDMLHPLIDDMLKQRKLALEKVNAKYGTNITVELDGAWKTNKVQEKLELDLMKKDDKVEEVDKTTDEEQQEDVKEGDDNE